MEFPLESQESPVRDYRAVGLDPYWKSAFEFEEIMEHESLKIVGIMKSEMYIN